MWISQEIHNFKLLVLLCQSDPVQHLDQYQNKMMIHARMTPSFVGFSLHLEGSSLQLVLLFSLVLDPQLQGPHQVVPHKILLLLGAQAE